MACFFSKLAKTVAKRYESNRYEILNVILFENYAYKNRTMPFKSLRTAVELRSYTLILKF